LLWFPASIDFILTNVIDFGTGYLWLAIAIVTLLVWGFWSHLRNHKLERVMRVLIETDDRALLFYDEHDRLVFHSSGLVLFDKKSLNQIRTLAKRPQINHDLTGEMSIDGNRYRYRSKLLEYQPGKAGTAVYLQYLKSETAVE